mgnify:CR=1 FL=1
MKNNRRSVRRFNNKVKQKSKYNIIKHVQDDYLSDVESNFNREYGKLVKGKVHCSCEQCSTKSKKDGLKHSERKQILKGMHIE